MVTQQAECVRPQFRQGRARGLRRDKGMPVAIAAHPRAKRDMWPVVGAIEEGRVETRFAPRLIEASIEDGDGVGKDVAQIVKDVAHLGGDVGLLQVDFAGAPQPLQHRLDRITQVPELLGRPHLVFALHHQEIQVSMLLQDRIALRLGRVRRQDGLDANSRQFCSHLCAGHAVLLQGRQVLAPEAGEQVDGVLPFQLPAVLHDGVFLDDVQELESNGGRLGQLHRIDVGWRRLAVLPGQGGGHGELAVLFEYLAQTLDQEVNILVYLGEIAHLGARQKHGQAFPVGNCCWPPIQAVGRKQNARRFARNHNGSAIIIQLAAEGALN